MRNFTNVIQKWIRAFFFCLIENSDIYSKNIKLVWTWRIQGIFERVPEFFMLGNERALLWNIPDLYRR